MNDESLCQQNNTDVDNFSNHNQHLTKDYHIQFKKWVQAQPPKISHSMQGAIQLEYLL
jgi:hypothetical protein